MATKDKDVRKSEEIFQHYKTSKRSTWAKNAIEDRAFIASVQVEKEDAKALDAANQPIFSINETTPARQQIVSQLTRNAPRWASYGKERSDVNVSTKVSDLMEHIWYTSDGDIANMKATEDLVDVGMWCMMVYADPSADFGRGEIMLTDLDPLEVYIDPNSKRLDTEDAAHKMIVKKVTKEYIKTTYPDFNFKDAQQSHEDDIPVSSRRAEEGQVLDIDENMEHEYYQIIDRYTKIKATRWHVIDDGEHIFDKKKYDEYWNQPAIILTRPGAEEYVFDDQVAYYLNVLQTHGSTVHYMNSQSVDAQGQLQNKLEIMQGVEHSGSVPGSTTQISITNKGYLIQQGVIKSNEVLIDRIKRVLSIGSKLYYKDVLPISMYPIQTTFNIHQRHPFAMGDVRLVRPLQQQLNKVTSKITAYISAITNLLAFVPQGSNIKKQLKEEAGKAGFNVFEVDTDVGGNGVTFGQYPPLPAGVFEDRQRIIAQIQRIMGAYPFLEGDAQNAPETYKATLVIQEEGQNRANYKRKRIEKAINNLAKVVGELIPVVYTQEKIVRLLKPNNLTKETTFNETTYEDGARKIVNDLSTLKADIVMISGSMLPTNRWARSEYYTGLFEKGILQDASVILRESEIEDVEEVIAKQDREQQLLRAMQQAEQQIKELEGQLQTKSREVISANEKVAVEKTKTNLDRLKNRVERDTMVAGMRLSDTTKNKAKEDTPKK